MTSIGKITERTDVYGRALSRQMSVLFSEKSTLPTRRLDNSKSILERALAPIALRPCHSPTRRVRTNRLYVLLFSASSARIDRRGSQSRSRDFLAEGVCVRARARAHGPRNRRPIWKMIGRYEGSCSYGFILNDVNSSTSNIQDRRGEGAQDERLSARKCGDHRLQGGFRRDFSPLQRRYLPNLHFFFYNP